MPRKYELRDACFACTTPYQVLGAISIVLSENLNADIYIFGTFPDHEGLAYRLAELRIFKNVYAVKSDKMVFLGKGKSGKEVRIKAFLQVAFPTKIVSDFLDRNIAYKVFYSSSRAHAKLLLQKVLQTRNSSMRVVIYDDGLGSYLEESHVLKTSKTRQHVEKILGWDLFDPKLVSIQLYIPEIAKIPTELKECPLSNMPRLNWNNQKEKQLLKTIFGVEGNQKHEERVILFDNVRGSKSRKEMFDRIDECYQVILNVAGENNVLFKEHPRSVEKPNLPFHYIEEQGVPMEVFYSEMEDLQSRILIAYNSTATYTPKMLFGKEPWVINLHRIVGPPLNENSESLYHTFLPTYIDKSKLLSPNTMEELQEMLRIAMERG